MKRVEDIMQAAVDVVPGIPDLILIHAARI
jgi:hypothetical protein